MYTFLAIWDSETNHNTMQLTSYSIACNSLCAVGNAYVRCVQAGFEERSRSQFRHEDIRIERKTIYYETYSE